jgi:transcriptional regulator with GAF, ATPase, and Fis domain
MQPHNDQDLAQTLADLASAMQAQPDVDATLKTMVGSIVDLIPEASWAGVSVVEKRRTIRPAFPADAVAEELDRLQTELGEGPLFDALTEASTVHLPDLRTESKWPQFVDAATRLGVHCMLSYRLFVDAGNVGVLNIYGARPGVFSPESVTTGEVLAQHAAVALAGALAEEKLQIALANRDVIGQAKGLLMQRDNLTGLQAFATLTRASQDTNLKLAYVAQWLVDQHEKRLNRPAQEG